MPCARNAGLERLDLGACRVQLRPADDLLLDQLPKRMVRGARTLEMNLEPSLGSYLFDESRIGKAGELVPAWVEEMLHDRG